MIDTLSSNASDPHLLEKLKEMASKRLSSEDLQAQRVSYVYGSMKHDSSVTREQVEAFIKKAEGFS